MGNAEGLVKIQMTHVCSDVTGAGQAHLNTE